MFTKQDLIRSAIIIWIIASSVYIGWDTWNDYKIRGVQQAYQTGAQEATRQLFDKNNEAKCQMPITVALGDNKLELMDVRCLKQQSPADMQNQPSMNAPNKK